MNIILTNQRTKQRGSRTGNDPHQRRERGRNEPGQNRKSSRNEPNQNREAVGKGNVSTGSRRAFNPEKGSEVARPGFTLVELFFDVNLPLRVWIPCVRPSCLRLFPPLRRPSFPFLVRLHPLPSLVRSRLLSDSSPVWLVRLFMRKGELSRKENQHHRN